MLTFILPCLPSMPEGDKCSWVSSLRVLVYRCQMQVSALHTCLLQEC